MSSFKLSRKLFWIIPVVDSLVIFLLNILLCLYIFGAFISSSSSSSSSSSKTKSRVHKTKHNQIHDDRSKRDTERCHNQFNTPFSLCLILLCFPSGVSTAQIFVCFPNISNTLLLHRLILQNKLCHVFTKGLIAKPTRTDKRKDNKTSTEIYGSKIHRCNEKDNALKAFHYCSCYYYYYYYCY